MHEVSIIEGVSTVFPAQKHCYSYELLWVEYNLSMVCFVDAVGNWL